MLVAKAYQKPNPPRTMQEARALVENGYSVHVLAWDRYGEFRSTENVDGVIVRSFRTVNLRKFSKFGLALGGMAFQSFLVFETIKLIGQLRRRPVVHAHDVNTLPVGCFLRILRLSSALVYDCREFTYGAYYEWFNVLVASVVRAFEQRCLRYADAIITVSDPIADYLRRFNRTVEIIYNCPGIRDIPKLSKQQARINLRLPPDVFLVSWVGSIQYGCRFDLLLAVATLTSKENIHYLVVGDGPLASEFRLAARETPDARIAVLPRVSRETALSYVLASDVTWAVYQNRIESFNPRMTIPWKFFESLACGVPVIVEAGTFRASLVRRFKCGLVLENDDANDASQLILSIANDPDLHRRMSIQARNTSISMEFNWEAMSAKLIGVYERVRTRARERATSGDGCGAPESQGPPV